MAEGGIGMNAPYQNFGSGFHDVGNNELSLGCDLFFDRDETYYRQLGYSAFDAARYARRCGFCEQLTCICIDNLALDWPVEQAPPVTISYLERNRNAANPPQLQEMESSSGAGALVAPAATFSETLFDNPSAYSGMTFSREADSAGFTLPDADAPLFETPDATRYIDHLQASNVRESVEEQRDISAPDSEARNAANILANGTATLKNGGKIPEFSYLTRKDTRNMIEGNLQKIEQLQGGSLPEDAFSAEGLEITAAIEPQEQKGFAKLVFPDGDYLITTHDVTLGRNMDRAKQARQLNKVRKRARDTLDSYRNEPSQPSQHSDGDPQGHPSTSSQSLEGRPAPPSNYSEHGGVVSYQARSDEEPDMYRLSSRKRRSAPFSKSSSNTSIAPAVLHTSMLQGSQDGDLFTEDGEPVKRTSAFLPVHTQVLEDITKVSKEHLLFRFNFQEERWDLHVMGHRAFVNEHLVEKGETVALDHNDEIMIATVHMVFKLPDNFRRSPGLSRGTFSRDSDKEEDDVSETGDGAVSTSPVRRLSLAMATEDSDDEEDDELEDGNALPKLKTKTQKNAKVSKFRSKEGKFRTKFADKTSKTGNKRPHKDTPIEQSPEASKKVDKGKKPKAAAKEPVEIAKEKKISPPVAPPQIEPGSALAGIPIEELPEKRKGPGRPPKNGIVSKRDQAMVAKRKKEYEKRGEQAPTYDVLVQQVRAENKAKEAHAKAIASGEIPPGTSVMPSIESVGPSVPKPVSGLSMAVPGPSAAVLGPSNISPAQPIRKTSPKAKRQYRTPSPFKPISEYTAEELKKPSVTYVHILDEILRNHPTGEAELQDIYNRVSKRYPHFHFHVQTSGWQSSVRHNLLQHDRFQTTGEKAGKGQIWKLNYNVPLEKEKKRKLTPPMNRPLQNGQYMQAQPKHFGQAQYGNPYAQGQPNGQPQINAGQQQASHTYFSPYAQPGQNAAYGAHPNQARAYIGQQPQSVSPFNAQQANGNPPPRAPVATPFDPLVHDIMEFRKRWMAQYVGNNEVFKQKEAVFSHITTYSSELFHYGKLGADTAELVTAEERELFLEMWQLLGKYGHLKHVSARSNGNVQASGNAGGAVNQTVQGANASMQGGGNMAGSLPVNQTNVATLNTPPRVGSPTPSPPRPGQIMNGAGVGAVPTIASRTGSFPSEATSQQVNTGSSALKRGAEDALAEPEWKRTKVEDYWC